MKYHQIITTLTAEPLLLTPATGISLLELFKHHASLSADEFAKVREGINMCGERVELDSMEIIDGIAHIPIGGPIGKGFGPFEKGAGAVDVADIEDDIEEAEESDECKAIILDIDSPGGMVAGTPELADRIAQTSKPIYAFSSGQVCSAAYWLAAATDGIFTTRTADIGSIGVYIPWVDSSEAYEKEGLKIELFTSGKFKGMGFPGTSLTEEQKQHLRGRVARIANMFYLHVRANRPSVPDEAMQGQTFMGFDAMNNGLVDQVVKSKDDLCAALR